VPVRAAFFKYIPKGEHMKTAQLNGKAYTLTQLKDGTIKLVPLAVQDKGFDPSEGCEYWYTMPTGDINRDTYFNVYNFNKRCLAQGNCYPSEGLASKASVLQKRCNLIIRACLLIDPDFISYRDGSDEIIWYPIIGTDGWEVVNGRRAQCGVAYVSTREKCREVVALLNKWAALAF